MLFLETRSGLLAAKHIVLVGKLCVRPTGNYHEIDYACAGSPHTTRATEEAVQEFLESNLECTGHD